MLRTFHDEQTPINTQQASQNDKQSSNETDNFFFISENIDTVAAGPVPVPQRSIMLGQGATCAPLIFLSRRSEHGHVSSTMSFDTAAAWLKTKPTCLCHHGQSIRPRQKSGLPDFGSCLIIDLGRETDGNNKICLGVRFALCIIRALRLARIEHCSGTVVTHFLLPSLSMSVGIRIEWLVYMPLSSKGYLIIQFSGREKSSCGT